MSSEEQRRTVEREHEDAIEDARRFAREERQARQEDVTSAREIGQGLRAFWSDDDEGETTSTNKWREERLVMT